MYRKGHGESRAYAGQAIYSDFASVLADNSECARQSKPGAFGFGSEEGLENRGLNVEGNTGSGVPDRDLHKPLFFLPDWLFLD